MQDQTVTPPTLESIQSPTPPDGTLVLDDVSLTAHVMTIHDLRDRSVWGFEVLIRGIGSSGVIAPDILMAEARRLGKLTSFDRRCFETTTRTIPNLPHAVKVFLNVYAQTLLEEGGVEFVHGLLEPYIAAGRQVILEIHESMTHVELKQLEPLFARLRQLGIRIALDDLMPKDLTFRHLRIRPDFIKVDRTVFSNMTPVEAARTISTFARCQDSLGYVLIVEGIEDDKMLSIVTFAGAWLVQGYLFGKPSPHRGEGS